MRLISTLFYLAALAQPALAQSASEKAEKRLADLLAPAQGLTLTVTGQPQTWKASSAVEDFQVPIKSAVIAPARLTQAPLKEAKPRAVPEGTPLAMFRDPAQPPAQVELPTSPLVRLPSLDIHAPLAIPILAQPVKDRASLGEPAFESSLAAAMKSFTPTRDRPVPFVAYDLPDPFEHLRYGQLRNPPEESATSPVVPLQRPTK